MTIPEKLTGELACILEDCGPPDRQSPEALAELIRHYQPTWDRIAAALAATPEPDMSDVTDDVSPDVASAISHFYNNAYALQKNEATPAVAGEIEACAQLADDAANADTDYALKYPDEAEKYHQRAHRARTIAYAIRDIAALPASPLRGREAGIKECIELIEKKFLVGWTITQNGLAREDEANDILEALRELSASPPEQPAAGDGETKA